MPENADWITPKEASEKSLYSMSTIWRAIRSRALKASKPMGTWRILKTDYAAWLKSMPGQVTNIQTRRTA